MNKKILSACLRADHVNHVARGTINGIPWKGLDLAELEAFERSIGWPRVRVTCRSVTRPRARARRARRARRTSRARASADPDGEPPPLPGASLGGVR